jgi:hypothetical protein
VVTAVTVGANGRRRIGSEYGFLSGRNAVLDSLQ